MRVSVDKDKLMAIVNEKTKLDCTYGDCPLVPDACAAKIDGNWGFLCNKKPIIIDWLNIKDLPDDSTNEYLLSSDEQAILRSVPPKYRYIARDKDCSLYLFEGLPTKSKTAWDSSLDGVFWCTKVFDHLFGYVQWTDQKPWLISDLLDAKKPTVDWSKVVVDTKVLVRTSDSEKWLKRHFAKYKNGNVYCFDDDYTSFTIPSLDEENWKTCWDEAKLYEEESRED